MEYVPWARAMHGVKICTYDILPNAWITSEREEVLDFSKPYAANEIVFIKRKNDPFEFNGLESLKGKHVGVVRGYGYNNEFLRATHFTRDESRDFITCIKKLINKRLDLAIEDRIVGRIIMANDNPDYLNRIDFTKNHLSKNELYICVGKNNPRKKEILKAFNEGLMEIKANGTYSKIMESFGLN
jgi:polar amino acid transport system substrate-binding protein